MEENNCVAVVAVHGIADQLPGQTVRELARLLCHGAEGPPRYVQGEIQEVLVPVSKLEPRDTSLQSPQPSPVHAAADSSLPSSVDTSRRQPGAPSGFYQKHQQAEAVDVAGFVDTSNDLGMELNDYLLDRLVLNEGDSLYETKKISLRRRDDNCEVDIFEMYWADLSRLGDGGLKALSSLYQLFFHLSTLSADIVDHASIVARGGTTWHLLQRLHAWLAWIMKGPAAIMQLLMFLLLIFGAAAYVPSERQGMVLVALYGISSVVLTTLTVFTWLRRPATSSLPLKPIVFLTSGVACLVLALYLLWRGDWVPYLYFVSSVLVTALLGAFAIEQYAKISNGVRVVGHILVAAMVMTLALVAHWSRPYITTITEWMLTSVMHAGEVLFAVLLVIWAIFILVQIVALLLGFWLGRQASVSVRTSLHTARLMLIISSGLFVVLSLVLWSTVTYVAGAALGEFQFSSLIFDTGYWAAANFLDVRIQQLGGFFTPLVFAAMLVGVAVVLVMAPSIAQELSPGINVDSKGVRSGADLSSSRLGGWLVGGMARLDKALRVLVPLGAIAGGVLYLAFFLQQFALTFGVLDGFVDALAGSLEYFRGESLVSAGKWLAGGALTITALGAHFTKTFGRLRVVIDAILDIDNYFADPPNRQPPRARIFSRYVSLLHRLREAGYHRIVIVAHSQGTVISAELLHYLHAMGRTGSITGDIPISLVTVGSPLRDLYARRFPLLYRWLGSRDSGFANATPAAADLGLTEWVNACRSGDYVGRFIWTSPDEQDGYKVAAVDANGNVRARRAEGRTEFCLGAGAHTHYFNNDAIALAIEIDRLVKGR